MEGIAEDKKRQLQHLEHRVAERTAVLAEAEAEAAAAKEEAARRRANTTELTRLEEEVEKRKRKAEEKGKVVEGVEAKKVSRLSGVKRLASITSISIKLASK